MVKQQTDPIKESRASLFKEVSPYVDIGDEKYFNERMDTPDGRDMFFKEVSKFVDIGTFDEFEDKIFKKKRQNGVSTGGLETPLEPVTEPLEKNGEGKEAVTDRFGISSKITPDAPAVDVPGERSRKLQTISHDIKALKLSDAFQSAIKQVEELNKEAQDISGLSKSLEAKPDLSRQEDVDAYNTRVDLFNERRNQHIEKVEKSSQAQSLIDTYSNYLSEYNDEISKTPEQKEGFESKKSQSLVQNFAWGFGNTAGYNLPAALKADIAVKGRALDGIMDTFDGILTAKEAGDTEYSISIRASGTKGRVIDLNNVDISKIDVKQADDLYKSIVRQRDEYDDVAEQLSNIRREERRRAGRESVEDKSTQMVASAVTGRVVGDEYRKLTDDELSAQKEGMSILARRMEMGNDAMTKQFSELMAPVIKASSHFYAALIDDAAQLVLEGEARFGQYLAKETKDVNGLMSALAYASAQIGLSAPYSIIGIAIPIKGSIDIETGSIAQDLYGRLKEQTGLSTEELMNIGVDSEGADEAIEGGVKAGLFEYAGEVLTLGAGWIRLAKSASVTLKAGKEVTKKEAISLIRGLYRVGRAGVIGASSEGVTEGMQTKIELESVLRGIRKPDGSRYNEDEIAEMITWPDLKEAVWAGATAGGGIGAMSGNVKSIIDARLQETTEELISREQANISIDNIQSVAAAAERIQAKVEENENITDTKEIVTPETDISTEKVEDVTLSPKNEIKTDNVVSEEINESTLYTSENGKATITRDKDGEVIVLKEDGSKYSKKQSLNYINESLENLDTKNLVDLAIPEGLKEWEINDYIVENSTNPIEVANSYLNVLHGDLGVLAEDNVKTQAIEDHQVQITEKQFLEETGKGNLTPSIKKIFINNSPKVKHDLSEVAEEINGNLDKEGWITREDILNFMLEDNKAKKRSDQSIEAEKMSKKFQSLTGRTLNPRLAEALTVKEINERQETLLEEANTALSDAGENELSILKAFEDEWYKIAEKESDTRATKDSVKSKKPDRADEGRADKLKEKESKIKDELSSLLGEFGKTGAAMTGVDPKQVETAARIVAKAIELGANKIEQVIEFARENVPTWLEDNLEALKEAYDKVKTKGRKERSKLKTSLEEAITHIDGSYSAYIVKQIKRNNNNQDFREKLEEVTPKNTHKQVLADIESTKLLNGMVEEYGQEEGLKKAVWVLDNGHIPELMIAKLTKKIALEYLSIGKEKEALGVIEDTSIELTDAGRLVKGADTESSVEARLTDAVIDNITKRDNFLDQKFDDERTLAAAIKDLTNELKEIKKERDQLREDLDKKGKQPQKRKKETIEERAKRLKEKAKSLKKDGIDLLNDGLKKQRGTLSSGFAPNKEIMLGLTKILHSFIIETEGNALLAFGYFKNEITSKYEDITGKDLDDIKDELIEANKDAINEYINDRQVSAIKKILKPVEKETKKERIDREEAIELIIDGLEEGMDESELSSIIAKSKGLKILSIEEIAELNKLSKDHAKLIVEGKGQLAAKAREKLLIKMLDLKLISRHWLDTILSWIYPAILSGFRTLEKSIIGSSMTIVAGMTTEVATINPKAWGFILGRAWAGTEGFFGNYGYVLKTGRTAISLTDPILAKGKSIEAGLPTQPEILLRKTFKELGFRGKISKAFVLSFMPLYLNILAWDQVLTNSASEAKIAMKEYRASDKAQSVKKRIEATKKALALDKEKSLKVQVDKEIKYINDRREEDLGKIKEIKKTKADGWQEAVKEIEDVMHDPVDMGYKNRRFRELISQLRRDEFVKEAIEESKSDAYVGTPTGGFGAIYQAVNDFIETLTKKDAHIAQQISGAALKGLTLFLRIGFNVMQMGLNWTPLGGIKASRGFLGEKYNKIWTRGGYKQMSPAYRQRIATQSTIGTIIGASIFANMFDWDDDEGWKLKDEKDMYVVVYGNGTGNWFESESVKKDWKPWSIKFRFSLDDDFSELYSTVYNPLGLALAPFGIMHDEQYFKDFQVEGKAMKNKKVPQIDTPYKGHSYLMWAGVRGMSSFMVEQSFNKPLRTISNIFNPRDSDNMVENIGKLIIDPVMALVPGVHKQLYDEYKSLMGTHEKNKFDIIDGIAKGLPFLDNLLNNEAYDILGHKIIKEFEVPFFPDSTIKWMFDNVEYREGMKDWELLWKYEQVTLPSVRPNTSSDIDRKKIEWTDAEKNLYIKRTGEILSSTILIKDIYKSLNKMSALELQSALYFYHSNAKRVANNEVKQVVYLRIKKNNLKNN